MAASSRHARWRALRDAYLTPQEQADTLRILERLEAGLALPPGKCGAEPGC